ncbi:adenosylcobinamide-phosphate synthase CbiB [Roseomonas sp. GC11]|uniref:adenosylcobinamide-phosphate synthase CbiB n=1 Tax=Roseomonas sp. GC11 TaxID=2950546 RepID=UPI00210B855F|nr:adenosylcobinamide-phosphate synthase CbiB [Roseomonas sp. GC11]MCQ4161760.1 adenosylcobinamide-phosphate synthase CbiB [Roseomonas sp. GC11]
MANLHTPLLILSGALLAEAAFGYPKPLYAAIRHPVVWMGALIGALDRRLNDPALPFAARRRRGVLGLALLLLGCGLPALLLQAGLLQAGLLQAGLLATLPGALAVVMLALLAATLPAQRSLHEHVAAVAEGLEQRGLAGGRQAVSMIVGRNPETLDEAGVVRAAIESLAENFSDGIVAPAFWCGVAGLPGAVLYKAINTADSMVGHRTPRHEAYGWASARLDDLVNLPASRLAALWLVAAAALTRGADARGAWRAVRRDARHHRSPNAGWPEAAMAGALGLRLAGPRVYGTTRVEDGWMGDGRAEARTQDLRRALALYRRACWVQGAVVAGLLLVTLGL